MAEPSAVVTVTPDDYAASVDLKCKPGEGNHTVPPCLLCEQVRTGIAASIAAAIRANETTMRAKIEGAIRARLSATQLWAEVLKDNERLAAAFSALRVVFDLDPNDAGRIAHEAWIARMLEAGYHPFTECAQETACGSCDMELMSWEALPEPRRLVREAGVTALFAELRKRAHLDQVDAQRAEALKVIEELRKDIAPEKGSAGA